jgi:hypothetical protein
LAVCAGGGCRRRRRRDGAVPHVPSGTRERAVRVRLTAAACDWVECIVRNTGAAEALAWGTSTSRGCERCREPSAARGLIGHWWPSLNPVCLQLHNVCAATHHAGPPIVSGRIRIESRSTSAPPLGSLPTVTIAAFAGAGINSAVMPHLPAHASHARPLRRREAAAQAPGRCRFSGPPPDSPAQARVERVPRPSFLVRHQQLSRAAAAPRRVPPRAARPVRRTARSSNARRIRRVAGRARGARGGAARRREEARGG